jgi:hypothetical protein
VAVEVELEPEWRPGREAEIAQTEQRVDEVEIVMDALAVLVPKEGLAGPLVVPGLERAARFHGREDVNQPGLITACFEDFLDANLLAGMAVANEFNDQSVIRREPLGVVADLIPQGFSKAGVVEDSKVVFEEVGCGSRGMTDLGERSTYENAIQTRENAGDLLGMSFRKITHGPLAVGGRLSI